MDQNWVKEIQERTKKVPISSGRSNKMGKVSFDDLVFLPAQLSKRPVDYYREKISSKTIIGKNSKKPIEIETPIVIGAMSFGAVSKEAKIALAKASTLAGTMENTGEGGVLPEEREFSKKLIIQYCYDKKTEVLTKDGWKLFKDLKKDDLVATLNPVSKKLEYRKPIETYSYNYSGNLYHIKTSQIDLLITPNHKIYAKKLWDKDFRLIPIKEYINKTYILFKKNFDWKGKNKKFFELPSVDFGKYTPYRKNFKKLPLKPFLEFLAYYITEGWCRNDNGNYSVFISQKKNTKTYFKIKRCLNKLPFKYNELNKTRRAVSFRILSKQLHGYCSKLGKASDKYVPDFIKNLSKNLLRLFLQTLVECDGRRYRNRMMRDYWTASKKLADDVQEIILKVGHVSNISKYKYENGYRVSINYRSLITGFRSRNRFMPKLIPYKGRVYSCEVPNSIIYVRRNGKGVWSGNSTGRFGITEEILKKADAIEIKIGQGAKSGFGGYLPGEKVTEEIAKIRNVPVGKDIHSPAYHLDIKNIEDLKKKVEWLRKISGGVPIIIKLAAGDVENDVKLAVKANPDIIAIDGKEGGTGAGPEVMINEVGIPILPALVKAREILDKIGARQELWVGGGLNIGGDFAKALALGADAVFCATSLLVAMGCNYCRLCYLGTCPFGITTQNPELRKKLNIEEASQKVANFIKNCTEEIKMIAGACGENNIHKLNKGHLRALNSEIAKITKVKLISE